MYPYLYLIVTGIKKYNPDNKKLDAVSHVKKEMETWKCHCRTIPAIKAMRSRTKGALFQK